MIVECVTGVTEKPRSASNVIESMDFITLFFIVMVAGTIGLAPVFGAESRRGFLRPDQNLRSGWAPARPWDLDRQRRQ